MQNVGDLFIIDSKVVIINYYILLFCTDVQEMAWEQRLT